MIKEYNVLDNGKLALVDYMGSDESIEKAARVSYGGEKRKVSDTRSLLRYLISNKHTSPLEMAELIFYVKLPIFVARQWIRHRTASVNEISGRYTELKEEFYNPNKLRKQSVTNKQGSSEETIDYNIQSYDKSYSEYLSLLNKGASREMSRIVLPLSIYTEWYWKIDLHNLLHFLELRLHPHAQKEIRLYAEKIALIVEELFPIIWEAFEDYKLFSKTWSKQELEVTKEIIDNIKNLTNKDSILSKNKKVVKESAKKYGISKRELREMYFKLKKIGIDI